VYNVGLAISDDWSYGWSKFCILFCMKSSPLSKTLRSFLMICLCQALRLLQAD